MDKYDLVVVGAGPGGYTAALRAAQLGLKTACVDSRSAPGGTCLQVGCIPSKALLSASHLYSQMSEGSDRFGLTCKGVEIDFPQMMAFKEKVVQGLVQGVSGLFKQKGVAWLSGRARLISPTQVEIEGHGVVETRFLLLATGSVPIALPFMPFDEKRILSSTGALSLSSPPKRLLVIGAGVIGVELASVYRRIGSEVLVLEMLDIICPAMDPEVSKQLLSLLKRQAIQFRLGVRVTAGQLQKKEMLVTFQEGKEERTETADQVLVAVGRRPYSEGLGLESLGIACNPKGFVSVNGSFQTSIANIYAIGDLIEGPMLAHRASEEGVAVAEQLAGLHPQVNYLAIANVIYTYPEVAAVGLTEPEARATGRPLLVGNCSMRACPRARCAGESEGWVKVIGDQATGRLLGMHIIASQASEMIAEGATAIACHATVEQLANLPHAHPSLAEAIKEACLDALGRPLNTG